MGTFKIEAGIVGEGTKVWVDDEPQEGIIGLELHIGSREATQLVLYRTATGTVEGEAQVTQATPAELGPQVLKWLQSLDPKVIEKKATDGMGWGDGNLTEAILNTLAEEIRSAT